MKKISTDLVQRAFELAQDNYSDWDCEPTLRENYSGRGMYNKNCFGVVGRGNFGTLFLLGVAEAVMEVSDGDDYPDDRDFSIVWDLAKNMTTDNMARDTIFYFPSYELSDD